MKVNEIINGRELPSMDFDGIIIGGGGAIEPNNYVPYLTIDTPLVPAEHRNNAGMIGAAMAALNQQI